MNLRKRNQGFTLIETIVVLSILAILAGALIPRVTERMARSRDAQRLSDAGALAAAIEAYHDDTGQWPAANKNPAYGGWDVSHDGEFITVLREEGYLPEDVGDPVNDDTYHFRYFVYEHGTYGCLGETSYFVLGLRNFETIDYAAEHMGFFKCSGRDWGNEFAYVIGGGATYK